MPFVEVGFGGRGLPSGIVFRLVFSPLADTIYSVIPS